MDGVFYHLFAFYLPAISSGLDSSFKKDQDIIVLPVDLMKYDTHEKLTQDVLKHFGKVLSMIVYRLYNL